MSPRFISALRASPVHYVRRFILVLLVIASFVLLGLLMSAISDPNSSGPIFLSLISLNLIFMCLFLGYVVHRFSHLLLERKQRIIGARLHLRLGILFSTFALAPAVIVGGTVMWVLNHGAESWFSGRVTSAINGSLGVAEAYVAEHEKNLLLTVNALALDPVLSYPAFLLDAKTLQKALKREKMLYFLSDLAVYDKQGGLVAQSGHLDNTRLAEDFLSYMRQPHHGGMVVRDARGEYMTAITQLGTDFFMVAGKWLDPAVMSRMAQTEEAFAEYMDMREQRDYARSIFFLALLVVTAAILAISIWVGLKLAGRISGPVISLVQATNRVSQGDLSVRLTPLDDDELGVLTQSFNRMANQLKDKQNLLESKNKELDERRRVTEAVFSGVRSGVLNIDETGTVALANSVAVDVLGIDAGQSLMHVEPLEALRREVMQDPQPLIERQLRLNMEDEDKTIRMRMVPQMSTGGRVRSIVATFDDVTELLSAQKLSAWSDVARRIAHEIKNPLTPIQLSAERLQRRYTKVMNGDDKELFEQLTSTIIRQVNDMRQMVNEFSDFARMPTAKMQKEDLGVIIQDVIFLQREARPAIAFSFEKSVQEPCFVNGDRSQISRVFTNVIENAVNAIEESAENKGYLAEDEISDEKVTNHEIKVVVELSHDGKLVTVVKDDGPGLPKDMDTDTLFDPYVTTRKKGTGLGLAIVKRVIDEHGGQIRLMRRTECSGTCVEIVLPTYKETA